MGIKTLVEWASEPEDKLYPINIETVFVIFLVWILLVQYICVIHLPAFLRFASVPPG